MRPRALFWMEVEEWKKRIAEGKAPAEETCLQKVQLDSEPKALEGDAAPARAIRFVVSRNTVDRDNDTIDQKGWNLDSFRKNPVVPFAHDYRSLPVAKAVDTSIEDGALISTAVFPTRDIYPFGDTVYQMIREGFLNAVSVGFRPKKHEVNKDRGGFDFLEQELLEYSIVPVPSNPEALVQARSKGIDITPIKSWAIKALDEWHQAKGIWMPKEILEGMVSQLKGTAVTLPGREWSVQREDGSIIRALIKTEIDWLDDNPPASVETETPTSEEKSEESPETSTADTEGHLESTEKAEEVEEGAEVFEIDLGSESEKTKESDSVHQKEEDEFDFSDWDLDFSLEGVDLEEKGSEELQALKQAVEESYPGVKEEKGRQKINPIVLRSPLPGSYQAITRQLEDQAQNFLTANGEPFRQEEDHTLVLATFADYAIFCTLGMDRPFEDDPCYKANWVKSDDAGGLPHWVGEPKKIDIQVSMEIVQQSHLAGRKKQFDGTDKDQDDEEFSEAEIDSALESLLSRTTGSLGEMVAEATTRAIRHHQGLVD